MAEAEVLGVSPRQVRHLRGRFEQDRISAVVHHNPKRTPVNRTNPQIVARISPLVCEGSNYDVVVRVTQVLALLDLAPEVLDAIVGLDDPVPQPIISERILRPLLRLPPEMRMEALHSLTSRAARH